MKMDSNVTPVQAPTHRVPVAKLDRVNDELKRLCDDRIISREASCETQYTGQTETKWKAQDMHRPKLGDQ